jgi:hypothetical protein
MYTALTHSVVFSISVSFLLRVFFFFFSHSCSLVFSLSSYSFRLLRNLFNKNLMCSDSFWTDSILLLDVYCSNSSYEHWKHGYLSELCIGCCNSSLGSYFVDRIMHFNSFGDQTSHHIWHVAQLIKENVIYRNIWRRHSWCRSPLLPTVFRLCSPLRCHHARTASYVATNLRQHATLGAGAFMVGQLGSGNHQSLFYIGRDRSRVQTYMIIEFRPFCIGC